jgi:hypothetical protein
MPLIMKTIGNVLVILFSITVIFSVVWYVCEMVSLLKFG